MGKREELKQRRSQERRRQIVSLALVMAGVGAVAAGLLVLPNLTPVGDVTEVATRQRPMVSGTSMGAADAPVVLEIFEDFQCPACRQFNLQSEQLVEQELVATGLVRVEFRQYPFIGNESVQASNASLCAADQGRFWDYHDILFANQTGENVGAFTERRLLAFAETLGLDMNSFETCLSEELHQDRIDADRALGLSYGISGTPSFIINGTQFSKGFVPSFDQLKTAVEQASGG